MRPSFGRHGEIQSSSFGLYKFALAQICPRQGEIPRVQISDLCGGCISLSNAEGLGESLRLPGNCFLTLLKTLRSSSWIRFFTDIKKPPARKLIFQFQNRRLHLRPYLQPFGCFLPLFCGLKCPPFIKHKRSVVLQPFNGCPLSLFCSLSATFCRSFMKIWIHLCSDVKKSTKIRLQ